ncbi:MAG: Rid family hydrolase [Stellaceae bacterium]
MRRLISSGSPFEAAAGYSRAVVEGERVFVAGATGFDCAWMTIADDPAEQARQALRNPAAAVAEARASLGDACGCAPPARRGGLAGDRAGAGRSLRRDPAGGDGAHLRSCRSAHENRNRGDGATAQAVEAGSAVIAAGDRGY